MLCTVVLTSVHNDHVSLVSISGVATTEELAQNKIYDTHSMPVLFASGMTDYHRLKISFHICHMYNLSTVNSTVLHINQSCKLFVTNNMQKQFCPK